MGKTGVLLSILVGATALWKDNIERLEGKTEFSESEVEWLTDPMVRDNDALVSKLMDASRDARNNTQALIEETDIYDYRACQSSGCDASWLGDGMCDKRCMNEDCLWDKADCDHAKIPKVAYFHLRKTGGTSLHKFLAKAYRSYGGKVCRLFSFNSSENCGYYDPVAKRNGEGDGMKSCEFITREQTDAEAICTGCTEEVETKQCDYVELHHWDASVALELKLKGYTLVTLLREPISQLESAYNYEAYSRNGNRGQIPGYSGDKEGFISWLNDRKAFSGYDQLRMFGGCWYEHAPLGKNVSSEVQKECKLNPVYAKPGEIVSTKAKKLMEKAKISLQFMDVVGIVEKFPESIRLVDKMLNLNTVTRGCDICEDLMKGTKKENVQVGGHRFVFTQTQIDKYLKSSMEYDSKLYDLAMEKFQKQYDTHVASDQKEA